MATYKVIQDIEAEDKFLGPLTLKQFIFAAIAIVCLYLSFIFLTKGMWVLVFPLAPVIIVTGFLAFPWGRDQPTEVWLIAKLRFMFKPRRRIWDQTGMQELVRITAPKKEEVQLSDGLSQNEVKSRLKALAETIDSRGWAVKNSVYPDGSAALLSDRLVAADSLPSVGSKIIDPGVTEDMFDSPLAAQLTSQIAQRDQARRQTAVDTMQQVAQGGPDPSAPPANFWFMNQASQGPTYAPQPTQSAIQTSGTELPANLKKPSQITTDDAAILNTLHAKQNLSKQSLRNHKSISPVGSHPAPNLSVSPVTGSPDPVTIELARNNDRSVESLARETNRLHPRDDDDEIVISLH